MPATQYVAVIGKGDRCPPPVHDLAVRVGSELATLGPGVVLVNGGLGGVMDGSAKGMAQGGGVVIGLVPERGTPSAWLTYAVRTGLPENHRNVVTASAADVVIVLPGSHGTVVEGWCAADRHLPLIRCGDHLGYPSATLPFAIVAEPPDLPRLVGELLGQRAYAAPAG